MITFTDYQLEMAISRAYNAGKQNAIDMMHKGEQEAFVSSNEYFRNEFPEEWSRMNREIDRDIKEMRDSANDVIADEELKIILTDPQTH